jgi:hypothetical protein
MRQAKEGRSGGDQGKAQKDLEKEHRQVCGRKTRLEQRVNQSEGDARQYRRQPAIPVEESRSNVDG